MIEQRPHKGYALYELRHFRVLLLIPVLRVTAAVLYGGSVTVYRYEWLLGGAVGIYVWMKWHSCRYRWSKTPDGSFHTVGVRQGVFVRRTLHISAEDATSVEVERTPLLWLFGARRILISTAGLRRRADACLYLSVEQTKNLFFLKRRADDYCVRRWPVLVMSLTGSNAAVGLLTLAPILRQSGKLLGEEVTLEVVGALQSVLNVGLPSLLRSTGNLLLVGFGVSTARNLLRYAGFRARREERLLHISSGLLTRRDVFIDRGKITALELRQTLTMRWFSLYTAVVTAAGYGRDIGSRPVLIPAARPRDLSTALDRLLPGFPVCGERLRVLRKSITRYVVTPLFVVTVGVVLWFFGTWWHGLAALITVFGVWWFLVRVCGYHHAGFGCDGQGISLCYPRGLALYRVYLRRQSVDCLSVTQSRFQHSRGTCTVKVRCFGEKKRVHRVWGLSYEDVRQLAFCAEK